MRVVYRDDLDPQEVSLKLVRNPAYPGVVVPHPSGWKAIPLEPARGKKGFFAALEQSLRREGMRNPVILHRFGDSYFLSFGGSRVIAAQRAGVPLKAIINDWNELETRPTLVTPTNWASFFTDPPESICWDNDGFDYHYSIEKNRRDRYDPAGLRWVDTLDEDDKSFLDKEFSWLKKL